MTKLSVALLSVALLGLPCAFAQAPNFSGVWKADVDKSKFAGPPPTSFLVLIDQQGSKITETIGNTGQRGEQRSSFTYDTSAGSPSSNMMMGLPMQTAVTLDAHALKLESKVATEQGGTGTETWTLSPDGNQLTIASLFKMGPREMQQSLVLNKQPDSAGEPLRKPEQTAGERFKNVQIAKAMPASQFLEMMRSFTWSLGIQCNHCHAQGDFASDEKADKAMARKMMTMTHNINETTFAGNMVVHCYTCHRGQHTPQNVPAFQ